MNLETSETKVNLMRSFAGESMARNRYNMAASKALSEGHHVIAALFDYTAKQEQAHASVFYKYLKDLSDTNFDISGAYPVNIYESTQRYLEAAVKNEYEEYDSIYKFFGETAKSEGFNAVANSFELIAKIERTHSDRFKMFLNALSKGELYKSQGDAVWLCTNCGHIHIGPSAPTVCPVCSHPQGYFLNEAFCGGGDFTGNVKIPVLRQ